MRVLTALVLGSCLFSTVKVLAQQPNDDRPISTVFHVTSVKQGTSPDCLNGQCNVLRVTVEGYARIGHNAKLTQFVLRCDRFTEAKENGKKVAPCARLRAGEDYDAELRGELIDFLTQPAPRAVFEIVSQKEVTTPRQ